MTSQRAYGWWVLVVDDEDLIRWSLRERLQEAGYHVLTAETGADALRQCRDVDLVLLDHRLPDTDGLSVARALKRIRPACVVILMTAYGSSLLCEQAAESDVYCVVDKPFDLGVVADLVAKALGASGPRFGGDRVKSRDLA